LDKAVERKYEVRVDAVADGTAMPSRWSPATSRYVSGTRYG
jgi:hypothetical protein